MFAEQREALRLLVQEQFDDVLVRKDQGFLELELARLANNLAKDLEAHGLHGEDEAAPLTARAILAEYMLQAFARALAGHFDESQRGYGRNLVSRVIALE